MPNSTPSPTPHANPTNNPQAPTPATATPTLLRHAPPPDPATQAPTEAADPQSTARPYLTKQSPTKSRAPVTTNQLDPSRLLTATAPVTWGALINLLPEDKLTALLNEARAPRPLTLPPTVSEAVAVQKSVHHMQELESIHADPPENMFTPFTILDQRPGGDLSRTASPRVHWAHVDSGSMVCLVHEGVISAYPDLLQYKQPWRN